MGKVTYKKLQFDFSKEAIERLNELKEATDASSKAEVVRNSLRIYEFMSKMIKDGYELEFKKGGSRIAVVPLPL